MSDSHDSSPNADTRQANGRFGRGNPGKPRGARHRVSQRLVMTILADFETHQREVLKDMRLRHTASYAAMLSRLLPRYAELEAVADGELSPEELEAVAEEVRVAAEAEEEVGAAERAQNRVLFNVISEQLAAAAAVARRNEG